MSAGWFACLGEEMRRTLRYLVTLLVALAGGIPAVGDGTGLPTDRYLPEPVGTEKHLTLHFGPYSIPPGQDMNRITLDLPVQSGFYTAIKPNLVDALTGEEPSHQTAHIHHAHWLRITNRPDDERYGVYPTTDPILGLSWVFGTGEEKTQGSLNDRADAEPGGPRYGIFVDGTQPQALIYMIHNKTAETLNVNVLLEVDFVFGDAAAIKVAPSCAGASAGTTCRAGETYHALTGKLWGSTFDVPREPSGDGEYVFPVDAGQPLGRVFTAGWDGTIVAAAGHLHPLGKEVVLANLGPAACGASDPDADGYPGTTILHSRKIERVPEAFPFSEDYQMAATKLGFRAPVRVGDRIAQFGVYKNDTHASYEAMTFAGLYVDKLQAPPPRDPADPCGAAGSSATLVGSESGPATEGIPNHAWHGEPDQLCGLSVAPHDGPCDRPEVPWTSAEPAQVVHIAGFLYLQGDQSLTGSSRVLPQVRAGRSLTFVNEDAAAGIRHTVTACPWPCNGSYVANHPLPDGTFESHVLGNVDPIDGSPFRASWATPPTLTVGRYSYYCRIHPWMRGAFEVV